MRAALMLFLEWFRHVSKQREGGAGFVTSLPETLAANRHMILNLELWAMNRC